MHIGYAQSEKSAVMTPLPAAAGPSLLAACRRAAGGVSLWLTWIIMARAGVRDGAGGCGGARDPLVSWAAAQETPSRRASESLLVMGCAPVMYPESIQKGPRGGSQQTAAAGCGHGTLDVYASASALPSVMPACKNKPMAKPARSRSTAGTSGGACIMASAP
jgi:hypothetical protein